MRTQQNHLLRFVAAGLAGTAAPIAAAQPHVINLSGATLLQNLINAPAVTNDFIDANGDGIALQNGTLQVQQLAPFGINPFPANQYWITQYRAVGSVNGFQELVDFGRVFVITADNVDIFSSRASDGARYNRTAYITAGVPTGIANVGNPGAAPVRSTMDGLYTATYASPPNGSAGGIQIDMAPVDVPGAWAVFVEGAAAPMALPGQVGYGNNPRRSINRDGTSAGADLSQRLANLGSANLFDSGNPGSANADTIFDTAIAFAAIAPVVNFGVGLTQITVSDLRHLTTTGRRSNGENLVQVTRDSGSGTRNGFMNSLGVDPSWGVGENVGPLSNTSGLDLLGPDFLPSNKGGSSRLEATVFNHRLAVGYSGAERAVNSAWGTGGRAEVLAVQNDHLGGTEFSRTTIGDILAFDADGWTIGGPAIFAHFGDPRSGLGSGGNPPAVGSDLANTHPPMRNRQAGGYLNNITRSIDAFAGAPGSDPTLFSPGEFLAVNFIPVAAPDNIQDPTNPTNIIVNPIQNTTLKDFVQNLPSQVYANPFYASFGTASLNGKVPSRTIGVTYSDGVANGANYLSQGGTTVSYASNITDRNRIAGDFSGDAQRTTADATDMIAAWRQRNGGPTWAAPIGTGAIAGAPGADAVIEILGDFNGDGSFTTADVRYWADGLTLVSGQLDREAGFTAVDAAFGGNFFNTTLATGASYEQAFSRADVAGPNQTAGTHQVTRGFAPNGADGAIDAHDLNYIHMQFRQNAAVTDGAATWSSLSEAVSFDLSADMNADLVVNAEDIRVVVEDILGTSLGDVNLDGSCDRDDADIIEANLNTAGGWAQGDLDGDGQVTNADLAIVGPCLCTADYDGDGFVTGLDFDAFVADFEAGDIAADYDLDGFITGLDFDAYVLDFEAGC